MPGCIPLRHQAAYYVYILVSEKTGRYYIGSSGNVLARLDLHNLGKVEATRYQRPFRIVYTEQYLEGQQARARERQLKRQKSRRVIDELTQKGV